MMQLTIDPSPLGYEKPQYFNFITEGIRHLILIQNDEGYWGEENLTTFQKIYYTTQVVQCLLKAGFPVSDEVIQDALAYLDNFKEARIEYRAKFFLYLPLGKISEEKLRNYLELLRRIQRKDGSFFYEIRDLPGKETVIDEWPGVRRGSFIFYTLHVLHFLSMIDDKKYKDLRSLKNEIWNDAFGMLQKELDRGKPLNTLQDPTTGRSDPELTLYALGLLYKIGHQVHNFSEVIKWLLTKQVGGSWLNSCKTTSLIVIDLSTLSYNNALSQHVKDAIADAMKWLVSQKENWEKSPNLTALVINALISGCLFLNPNCRDAFFVNYMKELRTEVREKETQNKKMEKKAKIENIVYLLVGIAIPLIIEYLIIPFL